MKTRINLNNRGIRLKLSIIYFISATLFLIISVLGVVLGHQDLFLLLLLVSVFHYYMAIIKTKFDD